MRFRQLAVLLFAFTACALPARAEIATNAEHALLMDGDSGQVLWEKAGFEAMPPASMSKLMTLELLFQRLKDGRVKLDDKFLISERAWRTQGSKSFVMVGDRVRVEDLIRMIIIQSGNDACIAIAEALGGTVEGFASMMNRRGKEIGLKKSYFVNPDGLPDPPGQLMSAYDLALLARHLVRDYPNYYHYFGERSFTWSGITQPNRNLVLEKLPGADGLKTGHTDASGYGITASAARKGQRLILVLNGLRYPDANSWFAERYRADEATRILDMAFREFRRYELFKANQVVGKAEVWNGAESTVEMTPGKKPLGVTLPVDSRKGMKVSIKYDAPVRAPIKEGQRVGAMKITAPNYPGLTVPLYAAREVPEAGFFGRAIQGIVSLFGSGK